MLDSLHESDVELEDQNEDEFRPRSPIKRARYVYTEREWGLILLFREVTDQQRV